MIILISIKRVCSFHAIIPSLLFSSPPSSHCKSLLNQTPFALAQTTCEDVTTGSGVYTLTSGGNPLDVYCDMETDGGGWALFYKRTDGSINVGYTNVINGIGQPGDSEFVVNISDLKTYLDSLGSEVSLLIEMTKDREHAFALYQDF